MRLPYTPHMRLVHRFDKNGHRVCPLELLCAVLIFGDLAFRFVKATTLGPLSNNRTRCRN